MQYAQTPLPGAWQASSTLNVCRTPGGPKKSMRTISRRWPSVNSDSAWQPAWELQPIAVSVDRWRPLLATRAVVALVNTDASAAFGVARRLAGRTLAMDYLAAELGLRLRCVGCTLQDEHLRGTLNVEADALSRLTQGSSIPVCPQRVPRMHPIRQSGVIPGCGRGRYPRNLVNCVLHPSWTAPCCLHSTTNHQFSTITVASQFCQFRSCGQRDRAKMGAKARYT